MPLWQVITPVIFGNSTNNKIEDKAGRDRAEGVESYLHWPKSKTHKKYEKYNHPDHTPSYLDNWQHVCEQCSEKSINKLKGFVSLNQFEEEDG